MRPARTDLGDPHALLEHDDFLRALARGLVLDEARADDVVQQAWIAAIERGPDRPASLRAWLATAVRHFAWKSRRSEGRRDRHEQSAAHAEATPSVAEIVAREQARRRVVEAVLQLDEPNRTTLLLRYFERLPPRAIAKQLGVPVETVRTRIKRSLERLRARLDAEHGGDRATWAMALLPWAKGAPVGFAAAGAAGVVAGGAALVAKVAGGLVVMSAQAKLAVAGVAVVLGVGVTVLVLERVTPGSPRTKGASQTSSEYVAPATAHAVETAAPANTVIERKSEPIAATKSVADATTGTLLVHATWQSDHTPAAGIGIFVLDFGDPEVQVFQRKARTDARGEARLERVPSSDVVICTDRNSEKQMRVEAGVTETLELELPPGMRIEGSVVDARGSPVAGAEIVLADNGLGSDHLATVAKSDELGRFVVRDVLGVRLIGARKGGFAPSLMQAVQATADSVSRPCFVLDEVGTTLRGVVLDPEGAPVVAAVVQLGDEQRFHSSPPTALLPTSNARLVRVETDEKGEFEIDCAEVGVTVLSVRTRDFAPSRQRLELHAAGAEAVTVRLERGFTIEGTVRDAAGAVQNDVRLSTAEEFSFVSIHARPDSRGHFRLAHVPAGEVGLFADGGHEHGTARAIRHGENGETVTWDAVLVAGGVLRGSVVDADGEPFEGVQVHVHKLIAGEFEDFQGRWTVTDAKGEFTIADCPDAELNVRVEGAGVVLAKANHVRAGGEPLELEASRESLPTCFVVGRVVDDEGKPIAGASVFGLDVDGSSGRDSVRSGPATGAFKVGPLPAAECQLSVMAEGWPWSTFHVGSLSPEEVRDVGTLKLQRAAQLKIHMLEKGGGPVTSGVVKLERIGSSNSSAGRLTNDVFDCGPLESGDWSFTLVGTGFATQSRRVHLDAGESRSLDVELVRGVPFTLKLLPSPSISERYLSSDATAFVVITDAANETVFDWRVWPGRGLLLKNELSLAPGEYTVALFPVGDRSVNAAALASAKFVIEPQSAGSIVAPTLR